MHAGRDLRQIFARLRRNVGILVIANILTTLLGIVTVALNARALGPTLLGIFALIQAYVAVFGRAFVLDTWQAVSALGGDAVAQDDRRRFAAVSLLALAFDLASGIWAAGIGLLLLATAGSWIGLSEAYQWLAALFTLTVLVHFASGPAGILRALHRFSLAASIEVGEAALKAGAAAILFLADALLPTYVYSYIAIAVAISVTRLSASLLVLNAYARSHIGLAGVNSLSVRSFARFSLGATLNRTVSVLRNQGVLFAVNAFYGAEGAGLFAIAQRITTPIAFVSEPIRQAIYPELATLRAGGMHAFVPALLRRIQLLTTPLALCILIGTVLLGESVVALLAGPEYAAAYPILVAAAAVACVYLCLAFIGPLTILYVGMWSYLGSNLVAAIIWLMLLPPMLVLIGPAGAAWADGAFILLWASLNALSLYRRRTLFQ
jgi:O-antigen/teichoic acid export membrane protein